MWDLLELDMKMGGADGWELLTDGVLKWMDEVLKWMDGVLKWML